ncbi:FAD/NAD(P)-binding domain-containing protein [Vararia minispora EC-137]|uniref:FAD/NAD(P)-binding domain-containing protein n=1 Tax=Vararia minispora EC-137 TaxID=1314806 RepID=A0ACB8QPB6_9AGAM|nr:FAD/NAD(P)-binding domain-containing protein [Vararia minispora EC-137]
MVVKRADADQPHIIIIYEKCDGVGGVWRDNTYPGCGSDVGAHWYSLSSELNPDWTSYYATQPEIRAYWQSIWERHDLASRTAFDTEVVAAEWDDTAQVYHVTLEDVKSSTRRTEDANVFWWAAGGFHAPFYPEDVPGVKEFRGEVWHSARWRHDVDLRGKRVGVIGNGCSGAQFVPKISEDPSVRVTNFVRSPQWLVPRNQFKYWSTTKWIFRHVPFVMRAYRAMIFAISEFYYFVGFSGENTVAQRKGMDEMSNYIRSTAPPEYVDQLIPKYPPGCKRVIIDPQYLESLGRPNVSLNWTAINGVVEEGLELKTGEVVPLDVIIFATGFSLLPARMKIIGREGKSLLEFFDSVGGPSAYLGLSVPTFPNFYMCLGPNTAGGHASVIFNEEVQIDHALQLIKPVVRRTARSFEVRTDVFTRYNEWIQRRLSRSVWSHCQSYYRMRSADGRNVAIFPGPVTLFWWLARKVKFEDYKAVGAERFEKRRRGKRVRTVTGTLLALLLVAAGLSRLGWELPSLVRYALRLGLKST